MRQPLIVSILCLMATLLLLFWGFGQPPKASTPVPALYALVIESDTGTFLLQLRKGLQEAAAQQKAQLTVEALGPDSAAQAEGFKDRRIAAALLLLSNPAPLAKACQNAGIPVLTLNQSLPGQACVSSDDALAGRLLMEGAFALAGESARWALLTQEGDRRARIRAGEAERLARSHEVETLPWPQPFEVLAAYDGLVATTETVTTALAELKKAGTLPESCLVLGMDTGDRRVRDLEDGRVAAMVMDNPYAMGYIALETARRLVAGEPPQTRTCAPVWVNVGNMYLSENIKLVFPLLQ